MSWAAGLFGVLAAAAAVTLCGFAALRLLPRLEPPLSRGARLSLSFLVGCGLVGSLRLLLDLAGARVGLLSTFLLAVPLLWLGARRKRDEGSAPIEPPSAASRGLALVTAVFCAIAFAETVARPLWDGDQVTNWGIKAKVLHESGRLDFHALPWLGIRGAGSHPPLAPALLALVHDFAGGANDGTAKLFYALFLLSSLGLLDGALEPFASRLARRAAGLAFAATPAVLDNVSNGLIDLPLLAFAGGGLLLLARGAAVHGLALTAFGVLLKAEGLPLAAANLAAAALLGRRHIPLRVVLGGALGCAAAFGLSEASRTAHGYERLLPGSGEPLLGAGAAARAVDIASAFAKEFVRFEGPAGWGTLLLLAPAAALALGKRLRSGPGGLLFGGFAASLLAQAAVYFVYPGDVRWQVSVHLTRAVLHGALAAAALAALALDALGEPASAAGAPPGRR